MILNSLQLEKNKSKNSIVSIKSVLIAWRRRTIKVLHRLWNRDMCFNVGRCTN